MGGAVATSATHLEFSGMNPLLSVSHVTHAAMEGTSVWSPHLQQVIAPASSSAAAVLDHATPYLVTTAVINAGEAGGDDVEVGFGVRIMPGGSFTAVRRAVTVATPVGWTAASGEAHRQARLAALTFHGDVVDAESAEEARIASAAVMSAQEHEAFATGEPFMHVRTAPVLAPHGAVGGAQDAARAAWTANHAPLDAESPEEAIAAKASVEHLSADVQSGLPNESLLAQDADTEHVVEDVLHQEFSDPAEWGEDHGVEGLVEESTMLTSLVDDMTSTLLREAASTSAPPIVHAALRLDLSVPDVTFVDGPIAAEGMRLMYLFAHLHVCTPSWVEQAAVEDWVRGSLSRSAAYQARVRDPQTRLEVLQVTHQPVLEQDG
jgi:hypothetical protein